MIDFALICEPGDVVRLRINGELVAEHYVGALTRRDWERELADARAAKASVAMLRIVRDELTTIAGRAERLADHVNTTPAKRQLAWLQGVADGLAGRMVEHPDNGVPPVLPQQSPSYRRGYEFAADLEQHVSTQVPRRVVRR